jgi:GTP-binding protein
MEIRNTAIIAHVDHGKTTLLDGLLKQSKTFRDNEAAMGQELIMDSNDQERERGITILAKNTAIVYKDTKINIIDTPGHADFGGEVERTLNMADGAILLIDAQEGPMPQTKFVLKKALELGLKVIIVINKIDKPNADIIRAIDKTYDLILELAQDESQLDIPIYYAIGREGKAWEKLPDNPAEDADLIPILDAIIKHIPAPESDLNAPLKMLVSALDYDDYMGKYAIGKITSGVIEKNMPISIITPTAVNKGKVEKIYFTQGLKKYEADKAMAGDIVSIAGAKDASIGDTISSPNDDQALPAIELEEPTLSISIYANTSPFAGREGKFVTARHIHDRIEKELETNISMKLKVAESGEFVLSGRGELHLSVFIETLRREGYELQVGKPKVITKVVDGQIYEPLEELTIDVGSDYASAIIGEINKRRGVITHQGENGDGNTRLVFELTTRGILGLRNVLMNMSKGTAIVNSLFLKYVPRGTEIPKLRNGVLIAFESGKAVTYGLNISQQRGATFILPGTEVYTGMIIGLNSREDDMEINVTKEKKLTNVRASNSDIATILTPPVLMSLEQCIDFLEDDELLEVTPKSLRLRKKILNSNNRVKAQRNKSD